MQGADVLGWLVRSDGSGLPRGDHPAGVHEVQALGEFGGGGVVDREDGSEGQDEPGLRFEVTPGGEVGELVLLGAAAGQGQPVVVDGIDQEDEEVARPSGVLSQDEGLLARPPAGGLAAEEGLAQLCSRCEELLSEGKGHPSNGRRRDVPQVPGANSRGSSGRIEESSTRRRGPLAPSGRRTALPNSTSTKTLSWRLKSRTTSWSWKKEGSCASGMGAPRVALCFR
ncbi:hypothetical protein ATKI12_9002 [Kitasatospora sp. Ki12]